MAGLVIVAIPDENDRVWKVSSEKVPHLTLLFLGEDAEAVPNLDQIMLFVEHAANTSLRRFYLPVDRRGELGADKADVLFFKKDRYDFKAIRDFRAVLLQDPNIKKAYDASSQFETPEYVGAPGQPWIPHLTLGYPGSPAKPIPDDQMSAFYDVQFNKIAVWMGDYDGPEFLLKDYWEDFDMGAIPMDVAMSALRHVSEEPWSNFTKADYTPEQWHAACVIHMHDGDPTSKDECKLPVKTPDGVLNRNGVHAAAAALGGARGGLKGVSDEQKKKAATALRGYYSQLDEDPPESLAEHSAISAGEAFVLEHYGVKGMRWGVRRYGPTAAQVGAGGALAVAGLPVLGGGVAIDAGLRARERAAKAGPRPTREEPKPVDAKATSKVPAGARRKTKIQVEGGENHDASPDALRVAEATAKLRKSGAAALSNKELRELQERLNLERNVGQLVSATTRVGKGRQFVKGLTGLNRELNTTADTAFQTVRIAKQVRS